jgi:soluble lytic murein transglycosylase-like protein
MNTRLLALLGLSLLTGGFLPSVGFTDVYVYKDKQGVLTFTNVPSHAGYRRVFRDSNPQLTGATSSFSSYDELIRSASGRYSIDPDLIRAVIKTESDFNSTARSNKGAMGLMQLMPETARMHDVVNAYDPIDNIEGGVRHLKLLLGHYQGNLELSLAAYNAGIKAVEKFGGIPPFAETKEYVRRVLQHYQTYRASGLQFIQQAQQQ